MFSQGKLGLRAYTYALCQNYVDVHKFLKDKLSLHAPEEGCETNKATSKTFLEPSSGCSL